MLISLTIGLISNSVVVYSPTAPPQARDPPGLALFLRDWGITKLTTMVSEGFKKCVLIVYCILASSYPLLERSLDRLGHVKKSC